MSKSIKNTLTKEGKLKKHISPAIYFDSSVLIDYWITEGMEIEREEDNIRMENEQHLSIIRKILKSDKRVKKVVEIRKKLVYSGKINAFVVVSPLALLELMEWYSESGFKQLASESAGILFTQKQSKKNIGEYIKRVIDLWNKNAEIKNNEDDSMVVGDIISGITLNSSFAEVHGLQELIPVDIVNFEFPMDRVWSEPSAYAYLQIGLSDIMHILIAQHWGCKYIASFDKDFVRVKDIIAKETGMTVLTSPEEILKVL